MRKQVDVLKILHNEDTIFHLFFAIIVVKQVSSVDYGRIKLITL